MNPLSLNHGLRKMKDTCTSKAKKQMIDLNDVFHGWEKSASGWKNSRIGIVKGRRSTLTLAQATAAAWEAAKVRGEREVFGEKTSVQLSLAFSNSGV